MEYWKYYHENYNWSNRDTLLDPDFEFTIDVLKNNGVSEEDAIRLFKSGYVCIRPFEVLIDRYYGGALCSIDLCTRFAPNQANELLYPTPKSHVNVKNVQSLNELYSFVETYSSSPNKRLIFRGQTQNHLINREISNPYLTIPSYGEVSLLPSIWRKMLREKPNSFASFTSLSLLEWSTVFYAAFDIKEIERRHKALNENGEFIYTMSEMEECSDEMLREFGKFRLDLSMGMDYNLASTLTTLLQHYGLLSPVLDLTTSLDVALFFATHKYSSNDSISEYKFIGTNQGQSVIYLLEFAKGEMEQHDERNEFLKYLEPQRPNKQKCVICNTGQYSINLPAFYLKAIIILNFDMSENERILKTEDLFPNKANDKFLKALHQNLYKREFVTLFDHQDLKIES